MTVQIIKDQIFRFLSSDEAGVLAIKGEWGVGKTFTWKKFLLEAKNANQVQFDKYSYISLFGINSLDSLKYMIFESSISKDMIGTEANIDTFKSNTLELIKHLGKKSIKNFRETSIMKSLSPAIETLSFLSLDRTIICIDDLERKGKGIDVKDILGLVSLLKEQKNCKVVLLLNDGEDEVEDYITYREKVVDIELAFNPTPEESANIAYSDNKPYHSMLRKRVISLNIKNIRILKKIERLVSLLFPLIENFEDEIKEQAVGSISLFSWSFFCHKVNEEIPPLDFILRRGRSFFSLGKEEPTDKEKLWKSTLQQHNFNFTDELDVLLAEAVKTGYFVEESLKEAARLKNEQVIAKKSKGAFSEAWGLYHNSLNNSTEEVVSGIYESFKKHCKSITPNNLNSTVNLFRELGEGDKASEIISYYIDKRCDEVELFDLENNYFHAEKKDGELVEKFNQAYSISATVRSAREVLANIDMTNGWSDSDEKILENTSVDEYYAIFSTEEGDHLSSYISTCLKFGQYSNSTEQYKTISHNAMEALKQIASESPINKVRLRRFGVNIEDIEENFTKA